MDKVLAKLQLGLFYLLLLLLPTQIGRHFFFHFSFISGLRSDYLAPTIYLTDIIVFFLLTCRAVLCCKNIRLTVRKKSLNFISFNFFLIFGYLLFNCIFVASFKWAAFYKLVKITEFTLLGFVIAKINPKIKTIVAVLSFDVFYVSFIALAQFILQRSIGGFFWWLGERTFSVSSAGIATFFWPFFLSAKLWPVNLGRKLFLRPYATFPHPNVLAGFLAVVLPLMLNFFFLSKIKINKLLKYLILTVILFGFMTLIISFSKAAWCVALVGLWLVLAKDKIDLVWWIKKHSKFSLAIFYSILVLSIAIFLFIPESFFIFEKNWQERGELLKGAISMLAEKPFFGVGLNNFILLFKDYTFLFSDLFIFQPVHNIYVLILTETGIVGFIVFLLFLFQAFYRSVFSSTFVSLSLIQLFLLGLFDHYLVTLQQAQLLFTVFLALSFRRAPK